MELDNVGNAVQSETEAAHGNPSADPDVAAPLMPTLVRTLVGVTALHGASVVGPDLLDVNQGGLTLTEDDVLNTR
jgi:hypothetical protein